VYCVQYVRIVLYVLLYSTPGHILYILYNNRPHPWKGPGGLLLVGRCVGAGVAIICVPASARCGMNDDLLNASETRYVP
jgi:hypothetical protein